MGYFPNFVHNRVTTWLSPVYTRDRNFLATFMKGSLLIAIFLTAVFSLNHVFGQSDMPVAGKQCKALFKKRNKRPKRTPKWVYRQASSTDKNRKRKFMARAEDSSETGHNASDHSASDPSLFKTNISTARSVFEKNNMKAPDDDTFDEIRKMVSRQIQQKKDGAPLKLDPLYFSLDNDHFSLKDPKPFLVAVEFALQGRIIILKGYLDSTEDQSINKIDKVRTMMLSMGVAPEFISISNDFLASNTSDERRIDFTVF